MSIERTAAISEDGLYRYSLGRVWDDDGDTAVWVMLNPSTADDRQDDPTIRRVIGFSKQWGYGAAIVLNLFAYRSPDPKELPGVDDPVGPDNDVYLFAAVLAAPLVVCAWGSSGDYATRYFRRQRVREFATKTRADLWCLGTTKSGDPKHPLYIPYSQTLEPWL